MVYIPFDIIEKIGFYCDIDCRRYLGLNPRKIYIKKYEILLCPEHILRKPDKHIIIPIKNTIIQFEINRYFKEENDSFDYVDRFYIRRTQGIMKDWHLTYISIYVHKNDIKVDIDVSIGGGFRYPGESTQL